MIRIVLDDGSFEPGTEVTGRVDWRAQNPEGVTSVVISLLWHTEGKGSEDIEIVRQIHVDQPASSGDHVFSLALPEFPWSFSGRLISLIWSVEASLEPDGAVGRTDFVAAPGGREIQL